MLPEAWLRGCKTHNKQERNKKNEENARHPVDNKGGGGEGENILGHDPQTLLGMLVLHYATTGITPFHCHHSVWGGCVALASHLCHHRASLHPRRQVKTELCPPGCGITGIGSILRASTRHQTPSSNTTRCQQKLMTFQINYWYSTFADQGLARVYITKNKILE